MKIRTVLEFSDAVDNETAWRKQELSAILTTVRSARGVALNVALRAGVALLYAHWEGWVKNTSKLYVTYVNSRRLRYEDLSVGFLGNALKVRLERMEGSSRAEVHRQFARFLVGQLGERATLSEDLVRSESNLSSTVFRDIATRIDVEYEFFATKANLIDRELLGARNIIAHGSYLTLKAEDYIQLHHAVLEMLQEFTNRLLNAATQATYLRENAASTV